MKLAQAYSKVIKYGFAPSEHLPPYTQPYYETGDKTHLHALADYLMEQDDPRGWVVARDLGITKHPEEKQYLYKTGFGINKPEYPHVDTVYTHIINPKNEYIVFSPVGKEDNAKKASGVYIGWSRGGGRDGLDSFGLFTPEEARELADKLPPEDAVRTHEMLDRHFGKRQ